MTASPVNQAARAINIRRARHRWITCIKHVARSGFCVPIQPPEETIILGVDVYNEDASRVFREGVAGGGLLSRVYRYENRRD